MYTEIEQETLDIDWFFTNNENIGFVASGGGKLPVSVATSKDKATLLSNYFRSLPDRDNNIYINPHLENILGTEVNEDYLFDFIGMAKKGLYTYDKTVLSNFSDTTYHLVVTPLSPINLNELPEYIIDILKKTYYKKIQLDEKIVLEDIISM